MTQYHGGNVMGYKRGVKNATPINKKPVVPVPEDLEAPVIEKTEELVKEAEAVEVEETVDAVVDGVDMALNIRKDPEVKANNQIAILSKGTRIIVVDPKKPIKNKDGEWFKIRLKKDADPKDPDNNGFAMKRYIKIV